MDDDQFVVRDERGNNRTHIDNAVMKDYGWLIGAKTIGIYAILVMHADKKQTCHPSIKRIEELTSLSKPTVIESIKLLDYLNIVKSIQVGKQCTNRYTLLDQKVWRKDWGVMLNELTTGEVNIFNSSGKTILLQRLNHFTSIVTRPNSNKTQVTIASRARVRVKREAKRITWNDYLKNMDDNKQPHIQLIAYFFKKRNLKFDTDLEAEAAISRHAPYASKIAKAFIDTSKVLKAIDECQRMERDKNIKYTLETVFKKLTN